MREFASHHYFAGNCIHCGMGITLNNHYPICPKAGESRMENDSKSPENTTQSAGKAPPLRRTETKVAAKQMERELGPLDPPPTDAARIWMDAEAAKEVARSLGEPGEIHHIPNAPFPTTAGLVKQLKSLEAKVAAMKDVVAKGGSHKHVAARLTQILGEG